MARTDRGSSHSGAMDRRLGPWNDRDRPLKAYRGIAKWNLRARVADALDLR